MNEHEAAAAQIAGARKSDREREADRDCRIDGVASTLQYVQSDARRRRFLGYDHAVPGEHRTCGGEWGNDWIGARLGRSEAEKSERGELKWPQSVVLETWLTRSYESEPPGVDSFIAGRPQLRAPTRSP